jgi:hypothetical protein
MRVGLFWISANAVRTDFLARFETNRLAGWNGHLLARPWVPTDAALARLYYEDSETAQLDPFPALERILERGENRFYRYFRFDLGDVQLVGDTVHDVLFYHADPP